MVITLRHELLHLVGETSQGGVDLLLFGLHGLHLLLLRLTERLKLGLLALKLGLLLGKLLLDGLDLLDHPAIAVGDLAKVVETRGEVLETR